MNSLFIMGMTHCVELSFRCVGFLCCNRQTQDRRLNTKVSNVSFVKYTVLYLLPLDFTPRYHLCRIENRLHPSAFEGEELVI